MIKYLMSKYFLTIGIMMINTHYCGLDDSLISNESVTLPGEVYSQRASVVDTTSVHLQPSRDSVESGTPEVRSLPSWSASVWRLDDGGLSYTGDSASYNNKEEESNVSVRPHCTVTRARSTHVAVDERPVVMVGPIGGTDITRLPNIKTERNGILDLEAINSGYILEQHKTATCYDWLLFVKDKLADIGYIKIGITITIVLIITIVIITTFV